LLGETIVITFVELARFCKSEEECHTKLDRMLFLLKNSGRLSMPPSWTIQEDYIEFLDACEIEAFDDDKRYNYDKDMYDEKRRNGELAAAKEEGVELGMAQGVEIGMAQGVTLIAKNMLAAGMSYKQISQLTGLDIETVKQLETSKHID
jgi:predicted transposase/invertase (TIGR01784 family)